MATVDEKPAEEKRALEEVILYIYTLIYSTESNPSRELRVKGPTVAQ